jgi:hypothetical protein
MMDIEHAYWRGHQHGHRDHLGLLRRQRRQNDIQQRIIALLLGGYVALAAAAYTWAYYAGYLQ